MRQFREDEFAYVVPEFQQEFESILGHKVTEAQLDILARFNPDAGVIVGTLRAAVVLAKLVSIEPTVLHQLIDRLWSETSIQTMPEKKGSQ